MYGRKRSANHPQLPAWLQHCGYQKAVVVSFDGALTPARNAAVVNWPSPDGKSIDAFAREPQSAPTRTRSSTSPTHLHQAITQDSAPTVALVHKGDPAAVGYDELARARPNWPRWSAQWTGLGRYFADVPLRRIHRHATADEFFADYLDERVTNLHRPDPVSGFARHLRLRRRLDSALHPGRAAPQPDADRCPTSDGALERLDELEDAIETRGADTPIAELRGRTALGLGDWPGRRSDELEPSSCRESEWAKRLADRIQARSADGQPGLMVFNPCGFARRVALELDGFAGPIPVADPVKAAEFDGGTAAARGGGARRSASPGCRGRRAGRRAAEAADQDRRRDHRPQRVLRGRDRPATGGLRAFRDARTRINRLGMQLVFNPGSKMRCDVGDGHDRRRRARRGHERGRHPRRPRRGAGDVPPAAPGVARPAGAGAADRAGRRSTARPATRGTPTTGRGSAGGTTGRRCSAG